MERDKLPSKEGKLIRSAGPERVAKVKEEGMEQMASCTGWQKGAGINAGGDFKGVYWPRQCTTTSLSRRFILKWAVRGGVPEPKSTVLVVCT